MFQITFVDNETEHDDIYVEFNDCTFIGDSYYFLIDDNIPDAPTGAEKARAGLKILLTQWLSIIQAAQDGIVYLPFDFSDQFTRCLECTIQASSIMLCAGWSHFEGWRINPSDIAGYTRHITDFQQETSVITVQRDAFVEHLTNLIYTFQNQANR